MATAKCSLPRCGPEQTSTARAEELKKNGKCTEGHEGKSSIFAASTSTAPTNIFRSRTTLNLSRNSPVLLDLSICHCKNMYSKSATTIARDRPQTKYHVIRIALSSSAFGNRCAWGSMENLPKTAKCTSLLLRRFRNRCLAGRRRGQGDYISDYDITKQPAA